ncbi:DUF3419 family protein [Nitratireductor pacificus]|uniref:S-adenosylmethionine:diacylglycerol 3-amino-3-carboxypropyl transferase n=1 Tax=Nitratireductor pacificus pht-3B TaxID=391937 RepID=K2LRS7_9HYPH|nr:DUF3419 family protein [Nitratireductor pacificus]EKF20484.1 hypothetical protein NA2_01829 [Nitratireductor pacificus pht-3B]
MEFFSSLNFTSSNEDARSELAALAGPRRRLVCLTGSGTRPLDMLLSDAKQVIAIDINPVQNELLRLKIAAIQTLDHTELLAYLGILPCHDRLALHARLRSILPPATDAFWTRRQRLIRHGIWYAGRWEKVLRCGALGARAIRGKAIDALFASTSLDEQAATWRDCFDDRIWRGAIRLLGRPWIWTRIIGEPGGAFLPESREVERRLASAFNRASGSFFFRESDFVSLILRGCVSLPSALPLHLLPDNFSRIRKALPRLQVVDGGLTDLPSLGLGEADAFSLSDFGSYCNEAAYRSCWNGVLAVAAANAVFCERVFMNPLVAPSSRIIIDRTLSDRLTRSDRAVIYDIRAGHIARPAGE